MTDSPSSDEATNALFRAAASAIVTFSEVAGQTNAGAATKTGQAAWVHDCVVAGRDPEQLVDCAATPALETQLTVRDTIPVPEMCESLLAAARAGSLDTAPSRRWALLIAWTREHGHRAV